MLNANCTFMIQTHSQPRTLETDAAVFRKLQALTQVSAIDLAPLTRLPLQTRVIAKEEMVIDNRTTEHCNLGVWPIFSHLT